MEEFVSLYDHLGRAAGKDLGNQVAKAASTIKIPIQKKYVKNLKYEGYVLLYPKNWLIGYFETNKEK